MPTNSITLYCGNVFTQEQENDLKDRLRSISYALAAGRNQLGKGSYGKTIGRPRGVSIGEALYATLRGRPDAIAALFNHNPDALVQCVKFICESNPTLRAAILAGVSQAEASPPVRETQRELNVAPAEVEITDEMLEEIAEREATLDLRLRGVDLPKP